MFDYTPQHVGDLEIKVGDKLEVTKRGDDGWWTGTLRGVNGNFPGVSNFRVKSITVFLSFSATAPVLKCCR